MAIVERSGILSRTDYFKHVFECSKPRRFQFYSLTRTCLTVLLISPLWSRLCSCGKRTWHISCLSTAAICSHARCSICTESRLNVNSMSYFCPVTYGMLENKRKSDIGFMFVVVARYTTSQNVRVTPTRLSPPWNTITYVLPHLPWNLNKGKNE